MTLLDQLLAATPLPPVDATIDELLAACAEMAVRRQAVLDEICGPIDVATDADRAALYEIQVRQDTWATALAAAQHTVGEQRVTASKVRAYAAGL